MYRHDFLGQSSKWIVRFIVTGGAILSLIFILSSAIDVTTLQPKPAQRIARVTATRSTSSITPATPTANSPQLGLSCRTLPHNAGDTTASINSVGLKRTFIVHLAPSYGTKPQPLVINYHGYSITATKFEQYTNMAAEADEAGFILVFPQGIDDPPSWNAGIGADGPTADTDDVQFTRDMLYYLETNYCVDTQRVYVTGFSLGGGMAYRIACTLSDQIAAVATVAGAFYDAPGGCQPSRPVPVLEIHGQADKYAPYDGNPPLLMAAVSTYLDEWLNHDHCSGASQVIFQQGDVTGIEWKHCASGTIVAHYIVSDGGHTWPGGGIISTLGYRTNVIDANTVIWNFFRQFST
jgi:polyhydroxybutyrate depolymerase